MNEWYYANNNENLGPVSEEEMQELIQSGVIQPNTLVWTEGMKDWISMEESIF